MNSQLLHSLKWSTFGELVSKVLPPLFYIITARLLTPADFGIVATAAMVVAFASIFWEAGLSKALIQNQEFDIQKMSNIVFYTNITLSLIAYFCLFLLSDSIAQFFHDGRVADVLKVSGLSLVIGALMSVQTALLQKNFEFKKLFYSRFVGTIIPGVVAVVMAFMGYGYWSLVWGTIASLLLQVLILWYLSVWRPTIEYDCSIAIKMFHFSKWILLSALLSWFFIWGDIFVLGFFFTPHELGLYRTGNYFVGAVIGLVTAPIVPVMYSYFSTIQNDKESVKEVLLFSSKVVSLFVLPMGVGLYIVQNPISDLLFGEKWIGIASVIGYLALTHSLAWIVGLNTEVYKAIGKPKIEFIMQIITVPFYLIAFVIASQISFVFFLQTRLLLVFFGIGMQCYFLNKELNISFLNFIGNLSNLFLFTFIAYVFVLLANYTFGLINMIVDLIVFSCSFLVLVYFFDNCFVEKITKQFKGNRYNI
jgi:O-antigen/teichoic acid export membrane protein